MNKKWERILEKKLQISNNTDVQIEKLMALEWEELGGQDRITLHTIIKKRYKMIGRCES